MFLQIIKQCIVAVFVLLLLTNASVNAAIVQVTDSHKKVNQELFDYFTYDELIKLSKTKFPNGHLKEKLKQVLNTPIVDSSINTSAKANGKFLRVASWNIGRGINLEEIKMLFLDPDKLISKIDIKNDEQLKKLREQAEVLRNADIIVLNEVDSGMPRTEYKNIVEEIAHAINYNYAFGVEFLEVDPTHLGLENYKWSEERFLFESGILTTPEIDKAKYRGIHGTAILSKFSIQNVEILRLPEAYDWFNAEKNRISQLEEIKRNVAEKVFREEMLREIRHGGRMALIANITLAENMPPLTIIAIHLENRSLPKRRKEQLESILEYAKPISNPVVLAGDFNTTGADGSPTGVTKEILKRLKDPNFVAKSLILYGNPYGLAINTISGATNFLRKYADPTVHDIPIIAPNAERDLFEALRDIKFDDGYTFDFRGQKKYTSNKKTGKLANSNERSNKGFTPTYIFERPFGLGKYKLDWIFVKAYLDKPKNKNGSRKMAPLFGKTLYDLNYSFKAPLSDHAPVTVDIQLEE